MNKKYKVVITVILIPIILGMGFMFFNRGIAKNAIYDYISRQGIKESQLKYADFHKDFTMGGYFLAVYVEGEKPDIYYLYSYRDSKVIFQAYLIPAKAIKQKLWGGSQLTQAEKEKLKYPPLKN